MGFFRFCGSQKTKGRKQMSQRVLDPENHLKLEPMRIPNDAIRFDRMAILRCCGQKPKYKDVRRGLGRAVNALIINNMGGQELIGETAS